MDSVEGICGVYAETADLSSLCLHYWICFTAYKIISHLGSNLLLLQVVLHFWFLMENLWWPGLTFENPGDTQALLTQVHYEKKGFMLDTGHYLHTNLDLRDQEEAVDCLHQMLDHHKDFIPYMKGIHLQQSLTGEYVKQWLADAPHELAEDPAESFRVVYEHIFQLDRHEPFTAAGA